MIKTYNNRAAYNAATKPTDESSVSLIKTENAVMYDGVNVQTLEPEFGDAVYKDANDNKVAFKANGFTPSLLSGLTYVGVFTGYYKDGRWKVFMGNFNSLPSLKYIDICQYGITAISDTTLAITLRMSPDYSVGTVVDVTLTSATIDATSAAEISEAVAAKATAVGDTHDWWAYLADGNGNKVNENGTQIIIQCDTCTDYRFYNVSATGCTIAHITWGNMPASDNYHKLNGRSTNYRGLLNIEGGASYWNTHGRTLSANVAVHSESGNTDPMSLSEFNNSEYAAEIRAYYTTYKAYLNGEFGIMYRQKIGCFALPDGEYLTKKYGPTTAPTKAGGTKAKFPALNWAYMQGGHLWSVDDGVEIFEDSHSAAINAVQTKVGKMVLTTSTARWFAQRYNVSNAWFFGGYDRNLTINFVYSTYQVGAVALL